MSPSEPTPNPPTASHSPPRTLISRQKLEAEIDRMAAEITRDYADSQRLVAIGVLKGSVFFMVDLLKRVEAEPLEVDFFQTSSYGDATEPGEVRILKDVDVSVRGADVLLIEDIVDTGFTLRTILDLLRFRKAKSVRLCTLLDKPSRRRVDVPIDYCGFQIEDHFVVGYGLDYAEHYRNLDYIGIYEGPVSDEER